MTIGPPTAERRRHPRFQITPGAYVVNTDRPGLITDISMDGLSWNYIDRKTWPSVPPTLDILVEGREMSVAGLPYWVISDCEAGENDCLDRALVVRRRSVQFGALTASQQEMLAELIRQHCAAPLQPFSIVN